MRLANGERPDLTTFPGLSQRYLHDVSLLPSPLPPPEACESFLSQSDPATFVSSSFIIDLAASSSASCSFIPAASSSLDQGSCSLDQASFCLDPASISWTLDPASFSLDPDVDPEISEILEMWASLFAGTEGEDGAQGAGPMYGKSVGGSQENDQPISVAEESGQMICVAESGAEEHGCVGCG